MQFSVFPIWVLLLQVSCLASTRWRRAPSVRWATRSPASTRSRTRPRSRSTQNIFTPQIRYFHAPVSAGPRHPRAARHAQHARHPGTQEPAAGQVGPQHHGYSAPISNTSLCFAVREPTKTSPTISKLISIWKIWISTPQPSWGTTTGTGVWVPRHYTLYIIYSLACSENIVFRSHQT